MGVSARETLMKNNQSRDREGAVGTMRNRSLTVAALIEFAWFSTPSIHPALKRTVARSVYYSSERNLLK